VKKGRKQFLIRVKRKKSYLTQLAVENDSINRTPGKGRKTFFREDLLM